MKKQNLFRHLLACIVVIAFLIGGPAWGAGTNAQTLTWTGTTNANLVLDIPHPLGATASSGLPVTLRVNSGPAMIADAAVTVTGVGTVVVVAEQAGDATYVATQLTRTFNVRRVILTPVGGYAAGSSLGVKVVGNHAYLADGSAGLQVIDVSDPANPVRVGSYATNGDASDVQVAGNHAFVAAGSGGMHVVDVSNPTNPVRVGLFETGIPTSGIQLAGDRAYLTLVHPTQTTGQALVLDVSNPAKPVQVNTYYASGGVGEIQVVGNYAYVAGTAALDGNKYRGGGLFVYDVNRLDASFVLGGYVGDGESALAVHLVGDLAYLARGTSGLQVLNVSNPAHPVRLGGYDTSGVAVAVQVVENHAYVADGYLGLVVIDVSNPAGPVWRAEDDSGSPANDVQVVGNHAYVAAGISGLRIFTVRLGYPQTLELRLPTEVPFHASPVVSPITASSGLPVTLSVVSGPAIVVDGQLVWKGMGKVTLRAEQAGDDTFAPTSVQRTVTVVPPRLVMQLTDEQVELFWAAGLAGIRLQGRQSLSPDSPWKDVAAVPVEAVGEARVRLETPALLRYFRLLKP